MFWAEHRAQAPWCWSAVVPEVHRREKGPRDCDRAPAPGAQPIAGRADQYVLGFSSGLSWFVGRLLAVRGHKDKSPRLGALGVLSGPGRHYLCD